MGIPESIESGSSSSESDKVNEKKKDQKFINSS